METEAELRLILRTSYAGSLILTAGFCIELYLAIHGLHRFRRLPKSKRDSRKVYLYVQLLSMAVTGLVYIVDCLDKNNTFSTFVLSPSHEEARLAPDPVWWAVVITVGVGFIHLLGDALLAWRCYIVWTHNRLIGLVPVLPWVASFAMGIAYLVTVTRAAAIHTPEYAEVYVRLQAAYFFLSSGVNISATGLICFRLARMDTKMRKLTEDAPYLRKTTPYSRISMILLESALPFTLFGLACAAISQTLAINHFNVGASSAYHIIWPLWVISCGLAPQVIIFRIVTGNSWVADPAVQTSHGTHLQSIRFTPRASHTLTSDHQDDTRITTSQ